ncbi:uncharacterized protein LOC127851760 isoform X2 [Dreissena polymorpha]|nr:uncharacterized protein LOC127851760 isoform X2 [Dreissena polymorpha]XP_052241607.1 uncharacterized protein LOC127851760 isoform X2 [Dreissena polymorpha]
MGRWRPKRWTPTSVVQIILGVMVTVLLAHTWQQPTCLLHIKPALITGVGLCTIMICVDILLHKPGSTHNIVSLLKQYVLQRALYAVGLIMHRKFRKLCINVYEQQQKLLAEIISANKETQVARSLRVDSVHDVHEFRTKVPLTSYKDYERFTEIVCNDESSNVFFPGKVDFIAKTSGTTSGKSKLFPKSLRLLRRLSGKWLLLSQKCFMEIPRNNYLRKWLAVRVEPRTQKSNSSITVGPISGVASSYSLNPYVAPDVVRTMSNENYVIYLNLLFGLKTKDICNLFFSTSQMGVYFFKELERNWQQICDDIENGSLSDTVNLSPDVREALIKELGGCDVITARRLRQEFRKGFQDIVPRLWPECAGVFCLATGCFEKHADILRRKYLGSLRVFSTFHAGSEAFYGVNTHLLADDITYTAMTPFIFFEFIPEAHVDEDQPETLLCNQVEVGERYELVVTTWEGLYRYRSEDVVQIAGFEGTVPVYKYCRRRGDILCVCTERVPEFLLADAVEWCIAANRKSYVDFISTESYNLPGASGRGYYVIFIEMQSGHHLTETETALVDSELMRLHDGYHSFRESGKITPVKVVQVAPRTFELLSREIMAQNQSTVMQFKLPRIIRTLSFLTFLMQRSECETDHG